MPTKLQEAITFKLREILDPVVEEAGFSPEDYEIVWKPLEPLKPISKEEK